MNHWHNEYMAEYRRQEIIRESKQIRLEKTALASHVYRPSLFTQTMFNLANWMIATGKKLRKRYEAPTVNCNNSPTGSFAR
jgi:hypothetical protein